MKYNSYVRYLTERVFGKGSAVYQCMLAGERISPMVKASIKKKGKPFRIVDKKKLLAECKKCEEIFDKEMAQQSEIELN